MFAGQRFFSSPPQQIAFKYPESSPRSPQSMDPFLDRFFNDDFFGRSPRSSADPFSEMRRMRQGMMKQFDSAQGGGMFDSWFQKKFGGGSAGDISQREDDHAVYYDISIEGLKPEDVKIKVENDQLMISGEVEKKTEEGGNSTFSRSSFHRSFPLPPNVESDQVQLERKSGKLIVKFPKTQIKNA
jgi:HSP20 family molecular chaperone IbpA